MVTRKWHTLLVLLLLIPVTLAQAQDTPEVINKAIADLSVRLGEELSLSSFIHWSWAEEIYTDNSLGCRQESQTYAPGVTKAYRFSFLYDDIAYDYRATKDGGTILLCSTYVAQEAVSSNPVVAGFSPIEPQNVALLTEITGLNTEQGGVAMMRWSPSGNHIVVAGNTAQNGLWLYSTAVPDVEPMRLATEQPITALALAQVGREVYLAIGELDGAVTLGQIEPADTDRVRLDGMEQSANAIAINPDATLVAAASGSVYGGEQSDNALYLWNARGERVATLAHEQPVGSVAFNPSGTLLASGDQLGQVHLWRVKSAAAQGTVTVEAVAVLSRQKDMIRDLAFSPNGRVLASGSMDGTVWLWDLTTQDVYAKLESPTDDAVLTLAFSPDGRILAVAGGNPHATNVDNAIRLWEVQSGDLLATLKGHIAPVGSVAFSPQGEFLASAGDDQSVRLWGIKPDARG